MNFIAICLHSLDMRDFHSRLRNTPFLDELRAKTIFLPMGRGQGHHQLDSLNAEITGVWTARMCDSALTENGYRPPKRYTLAKTVIEYMREAGHEIFTCISGKTLAVERGMKELWLAGQPERLAQFSVPGPMTLDEWLAGIRSCRNKFYAHYFIRKTHRCWGRTGGLGPLLGMEIPDSVSHKDIYCARRAALEKPDELAALRRQGLAKADEDVRKIFEATRDIKDAVYLVYSNHGEVFDHFRHVMPYRIDDNGMTECTSHGNFPYEVLYANMQMWSIPGRAPRFMRGIGRSIDIAPTFLDLAGIRPEGMDGESMLPYFREGIFPERDRYAEAVRCVSMVRKDGMKLISRTPPRSFLAKAAPSFIRKGVKLVSRLFGPSAAGKGGSGPSPYADYWHELSVFDLRSDPYEYVDLIDTPLGREVLEWAIRTHSGMKKLPFSR